MQVGTDIPVRGGVEIPMALAPVASENHAGHLARSQFVDRTTRDGDLLVPGAQFPPQVCDPSHFTLPIAPRAPSSKH